MSTTRFAKVLKTREVVTLGFGAMIGWSWVLMTETLFLGFNKSSRGVYVPSPHGPPQDDQAEGEDEGGGYHRAHVQVRTHSLRNSMT